MSHQTRLVGGHFLGLLGEPQGSGLSITTIFVLSVQRTTCIVTARRANRVSNTYTIRAQVYRDLASPSEPPGRDEIKKPHEPQVHLGDVEVLSTATRDFDTPPRFLIALCLGYSETQAHQSEGNPASLFWAFQRLHISRISTRCTFLETTAPSKIYSVRDQGASRAKPKRWNKVKVKNCVSWHVDHPMASCGIKEVFDGGLPKRSARMVSSP